LSSNPPGLSSNPDLSADPARRALLNELPGELAARVGGIGQRRPPEEVRELVVALCHHRDYRSEELALLLMRNELKCTPSPEGQRQLELLRQAVGNALERKRRLGQYAVIWRDGKPVMTGADAPRQT
jgi:hypothetical protein